MKQVPSWGRSREVEEVDSTKLAIEFTDVYRQHADFVWHTLQRMGISEAHLEDVFQEVFIIAFRKAKTFDGSAKVTTWLYGICLRAASSWRRRAWVRRELSMAEPPEASTTGAVPDEQFEELEAWRCLSVALGKLDLHKRVVFVMYEIEELSTKEIATALDLPLGTVHSRLHNARKQVAQAMARLESKGDAR